MKNILTIDVEEIYHIEYAKKYKQHHLSFKSSTNIIEILDLLDEYNVNSTFFVVGEIAEKCKDIIKEIYKRGHEIAFHSYDHRPLWEKTPESLKKEIDRFNEFLNSIDIEKCIGFRAPSFSLQNDTKWVLKVLEESGIIYDSSIFPTKTPLYGLPKAPIRPYKISKTDILKEEKNGDLWEFPLLVYPIMGFKLPVAGGFFLRAFPLKLIELAIRRMIYKGYPGILYVHNWELDSETPKLNLNCFNSIITYYNIKKTKIKLKTILSKFSFTSFKNFLKKS